MEKEEIKLLVDQQIRAHEIKVGIISGIIGLVFIASIVFTLAFFYCSFVS